MPQPSVLATRILAPASGILLFLQAALVVTGGAVRLTGSGLGCPTWPECTEGSYTPVPHQAEAQLNAWIEFGNRLLTFVLVFAAIAVLIAVLVSKRKDLRGLAIGQFLGIFGQGILGGITVLTDLNPIPVAGHLLLSMILIAGATSLHSRRHLPAHDLIVSPEIKWISQSHLVLSFIVIIVGTVVTGSGPHAGDIKARRFGFDIATVAWIHAYAVIALVIFSIYYYLKANEKIRRALVFFALVVFAQGALGFLQYYTGVPEALVGAHLLGASIFWILSWRVWLAAVKVSEHRENGKS